jgi:hypothetical protein
MNYLDIVARVILAGGWALLGYWIWTICSTPESRARGCVSCGVALSSLDLANCEKCLNSSFVGGRNA